jgi:4-hydroxy-3-polyprenylbenzoate decarboxylase
MRNAGRGQDFLNILKSWDQKVRQALAASDLDRLPWMLYLSCNAGQRMGALYYRLVITRDPQTGIRNVGMYRLQILDERTLLVHWQRHKGGAEHQRVARATNQERIPAAIVLGGDPASMWCASAPLPPNIDEYLLAGYLRGTPVEFVDCISQPIEVPAQAEIVIEGFVDPADQRPEGPFGDHTGYYTPSNHPAFHVTAIARRSSTRQLS